MVPPPPLACFRTRAATPPSLSVEPLAETVWLPVGEASAHEPSVLHNPIVIAKASVAPVQVIVASVAENCPIQAIMKSPETAVRVLVACGLLACCAPLDDRMGLDVSAPL